jgi:hypothetical protein
MEKSRAAAPVAVVEVCAFRNGNLDFLGAARSGENPKALSLRAERRTGPKPKERARTTTVILLATSFLDCLRL